MVDVLSAIGGVLIGLGAVIFLRPTLLFKIRDPPMAPEGSPQRAGATVAYQFIGVFLVVLGLWLALAV